MRIGYPCINRSIGCTPSHTFRLGSYSDERFRATVQANLSCIRSILEYNARQGMFFLRITSDLVPFASHPICRFPWQEHFFDEFQRLGEYIKKHRFRISMHPDQFVLLNTPNEEVLRRSIGELVYHVRILDLMGLDRSAKIQLHVGGIYGNKIGSMERFIHVYDRLDDSIQQRLVIENDERLYAVSDCIEIHQKTGVPVLFDRFHHAINNQGEAVRDLLPVLKKTWKPADGIPMTDYSSQQPGKRIGAHTEHIDTADFTRFLTETSPVDCDIMLEIKDKEKSVLAALDVARDDPRLFTGET
ncbi:MAG: UV DNA damage repair endonuclease UvsE [Methanoregula sp.]|nr:UV DNA damage repair endonuclease UvsE [Methanoregula sp.]